MKRLLKLKFIIPAVIALAAGITLPIVLIPHTHKVVDETWQQDATNHWHTCAKCEELVDLAAHEFGEWQFATDKCEKSHACITCGYVVTEEVAHTYDDACDTECNVCGTERTITHTCDALIALKNPTCTDKGMKAHYECAVCDKYLDENKNEVTYESLIIEALGHTYGELVAKVDATCTENGLDSHYHCSVCDEYFDSEKKEIAYSNLVIVSSGHNYGELIAEVAATCEAAGKKAHYHCNACDKYFDTDKKEITAESLVINALGHNYGELVAEVPATCEATGTEAHYECSGCHKLFDVEKVEVTAESLVIALADHTYGTLIAEVPATCEATGTKVHYKCSVCEKLFDAEKAEVEAEDLVIALADHTYGTLIAKVPATCEITGTEAHYKCSVCEKLFDTEKVEVEAGDLVITLADHTYGTLIAEVPATCLKTGTKAHYKCSVCEKLFDTEKVEVEAEDLVISIGDHAYGELIAEKAPKCTETGLEEHYECSVCEKLFDAEKEEVTTEELTISAAGHTYNEPSYTWNDDYTKCTATKVCSKDASHVISETVDSTYEVTVEPSEEDGEGVYTSNAFTDPDFEVQIHTVVLPAINHTYDSEPTYTWNADNTVCIATINCSDDGCDKVITEESTATVVTVAASCETAGSVTYNAVFKNSLFKGQTKVEEIKALGHAYGEVSYVWNNDNSKVTATRVCANNDSHVETETVDTTSTTDEPKCEVAGKTTYKAEFENEAFKTQTKIVEIAALEHELGDVVYLWSEDYSSCTATVKCTLCTVVQEQETVNSETTTTATCTEAGVTTYVATFTKEGFEKQTKESPVAALGHDLEEVEAIDPTCTTDGNVAHNHCTVCEKNFDNEENELETIIVSKLGHDIRYSNEKITCENECGLSYTLYYVKGTINEWKSLPEYRLVLDVENKKASILIEIFENEEFKIADYNKEWLGWSKLSNSIKDKTVLEAADEDDNIRCKKDGIFLITADYSGSTVKFTIEKAEHTHTKAENAEFTIDEEAHYYACTTCLRGKIEYEHHNFTEEKECQTTCPTCGYVRTTTVQHTYDHGCDDECNVCGETRNVAPHAYGTKVEKVAATCTTDGNVAHYQCSTCNQYFDVNYNVIESVVIEKLGHEYAKAWSSDEDGHYHVCTRTNCGVKDEVVPHIPGAAATETTPQTCTVCEYVIVPALGHTCVFNEVEDDKYIKTPATCISKAVYNKSCTCGKVSEETFEGSSFGDHNLDDIEAEAPNCTDTGLLAHEKCTLCNKLFLNDEEVELNDLVVKPNGHSLEKVNLVDATCTKDGNIEHYNCTVCNKKFDAEENGNELTDVTIPFGHKFEYEETNSVCSLCDKTVKNLFVRGSVSGTNWPALKQYCLTIDPQNINKYNIIVVLEKDDEFKIATDNWDDNIQVHFKNITSGAENFEGTGSETARPNIKVVNAGIYTITVTKSNGEYSMDISSIDHTHIANTENGLIHDETNHWYSCSTCANGKVNVETHDLGELISEKAPNCTETGFAAHYLCECGQYFDAEEVAVEKEDLILDIKHTYESVVTAPTCLEDGYTTYTCECGDSYVDDEVEALGHDMVTDVAVAPSCTETGLTEGSHCSRCDEATTAQEVVNALGHNMITDEAVEPTCTTTGLTEGSHCSRCNDATTAQEVVNALGHNMIIDEAVPATCTETGLTEGSHCSRCNGATTAQEVVKALGHNTVIDKAVDPTCTETGLTAGSHCSRCDDVTVEQEIIAAKGHNMLVDAAVAPTCTETGLTEGSHCSRCDHKVAQTIVDALGHNMITDAAVAPTCTETGLTEGSHCSRCDKATTAQEIVNALGHTLNNVEAKDKTCELDGNIAHKHCSTCNKNFDAEENILENVTIPAGHEYGDLHERVESKCEVEGNIAYYQCSDCDKYFNESKVEVQDITIDALEHIYAEVWSSNESGHYHVCTRVNCNSKDEVKEHTPNVDAPTETVAKYCTTCNYVIAPMLDHICVYDEEVVHNDYLKTPATCNAYAVYYRSCSCGNYLENDENTFSGTEYAEHNYGTLITEVAKTCTTDGKEAHYKCTVCNKLFQEVTVDEITSKVEVSASDLIIPASHEYGDLIVEVAKTCTTDGKEAHYECSACHKLFQDVTVNEVTSKVEVSASDLIIPASHEYESVVTAPTCTEKGYTTHTCSVCDDVKEDTYVDENGHDYESVVTAPKCTETGYTTHTCHCGDTYVDDYVDATGHTFNSPEYDWNENATQVEIYRICVNCPLEEDEMVDRNSLEIIKEPDCTNSGSATYTTTEFSTNLEINIEVPALGHNWKDATCTDAKTCKTCGETEGEPNGHSMSDATCTAPKTCSVCGATEGESLGHSYIYEVTTQPTDTEEGLVTLTCSRNNEHIKTAVLPSLNDADYTHGEDVYEDCELGGTRAYTYNTLIENIEISFEIDLDSKEHDWEDATCTSSKTCNTCGKVEGEALGHKYTYDYVNGRKSCLRCENEESLEKSNISLPGSFNSWNTNTKFYKTSDSNWVRIDLNITSANSYTFKIVENSTWYGNNGTIEYNTLLTSAVGWTFYSDAGNCTLKANIAVYSFYYNASSHTLVIVEQGKLSLVGNFNSWTVSDTTTNLKFDSDSTKLYYDITINGTSDNMVKVAYDHAWDTTWGGSAADGNYELPNVAGSYRIYFDVTTQKITYAKL